jgi:hypothetical protein
LYVCNKSCASWNMALSNVDQESCMVSYRNRTHHLPIASVGLLDSLLHKLESNLDKKNRSKHVRKLLGMFAISMIQFNTLPSNGWQHARSPTAHWNTIQSLTNLNLTYTCHAFCNKVSVGQIFLYTVTWCTWICLLQNMNLFVPLNDFTCNTRCVDQNPTVNNATAFRAKTIERQYKLQRSPFKFLASNLIMRYIMNQTIGMVYTYLCKLNHALKWKFI